MASKAQQTRFIGKADEQENAVVSIIHQVGRAYGVQRVFADLMEISAIALARADLSQFEAREARYLQIIGQYEKTELNQLVQAFSHLVMAYEKRVTRDYTDFADVLGKIYMMLDLGNASNGQFFTPYEISLLMAKMQVSCVQELVDTNGFIRVHEPACGAGAMIIAVAQVLAEQDINYQQCMHVVAIDIDARCVHMTFIQLALLNIPAVVIQGNSLTCEMKEYWYTPAHLLGGWSTRLRTNDGQRRASSLLKTSGMADVSPHEELEVSFEPMAAEQMALF